MLYMNDDDDDKINEELIWEMKKEIKISVKWIIKNNNLKYLPVKFFL